MARAVVRRNDIFGGEFFVSINELVLLVLLTWQKPLGHSRRSARSTILGIFSASHVLSNGRSRSATASSIGRSRPDSFDDVIAGGDAGCKTPSLRSLRAEGGGSSGARTGSGLWTGSGASSAAGIGLSCGAGAGRKASESGSSLRDGPSVADTLGTANVWRGFGAGAGSAIAGSIFAGPGTIGLACEPLAGRTTARADRTA